jgi:pimeloyl-ACP methyl ester carboxylesterase
MGPRRAGALSMHEGMFVEIDGVPQWVTIRGSDLHNPILLILHGTGFALSSMPLFFAPWETDFTVVQWDQPGAGATYAKNSGTGMVPLTLDRITRDGIAIAEFIRRRLDADKLVLAGLSGGSIIGLKMVKERPDLFSAYVGSGQFVNWARQETLSYAMVLDQARAAGDQKAIAELEQIGPPPYKDVATDAIKSKYAGAPTSAERAVFATLDLGHPILDARAVAMETFAKLKGELVGFDARRLGLQFDVPMFFFQGERDTYSVTAEVQAYEAEIQAPNKMIVPVKGGGHSCYFMRDEFLALLNTYVVPTLIPS